MVLTEVSMVVCVVRNSCFLCQGLVIFLEIQVI